jgi:hypothetical protein
LRSESEEGKYSKFKTGHKIIAGISVTLKLISTKGDEETLQYLMDLK